MAGLQLNHIYKVYPNGTKAVNDFNMEIKDKEFIVFVGPSGCGKSTTLRMIAGLEEITAGELHIGDIVVNDVEPKDRDIAMVFQNYALYPHMTVYENMAFGLKMRKVPKAVIKEKVMAAAETLGITEYLNRKPKEMSGGQRQRVALGRAMVREPKVFLLDEPLSNLDAKLRTAMRSEIAKLHRKLQTTFIYVTHDQVEAMTMGTRIVVMKSGFIQQIDTPRNLYNYPSNKFVAGFIGTPQMNFFHGKLTADGDKVNVSFDNTGVSFNAPKSLFDKADGRFLDGRKGIVLGIRAEHISVDPDKYPYMAKCVVSNVEELGTESLVYADFNVSNDETYAESDTRVIIKAPAGAEYQMGQIVEVSLDLSQLKAFDAKTENTIMPRIPDHVVTGGIVKDGELLILGTKLRLPPAMNVENGQWLVNIPTESVSLGGDIPVKSIEEEKVNDETLLHVKVDDVTLFAIKSDDRANENSISVDLKKLTFIADDKTFDAIPDENTLDGKLTRKLVKVEKEVKGKLKKVKDFEYSYIIDEHKFDCPYQAATRIVSGAGFDVFNKELAISFSPYQAKVADTGIPAKVEKVLDYGKEYFALCNIGGKKVYVSVDNDFDQTDVLLDIDTQNVIVVEKARDIRLL